MVLDFNKEHLLAISSSLYTQMASIQRMLEIENDPLERSELRDEIIQLKGILEMIDTNLFKDAK